MLHRRRLTLHVLVVFGLLAGEFPASTGRATTVIAPMMKPCPIGGEPYQPQFSDEIRLEREETPAELMAGAMVVLSLDQCPNGFLVYKPVYSKAELASLARLIVEPEFKALRNEPTYAQLYWIRARQGAGPFELADLRFHAARERPFHPDVSRKYKLLYIEDVNALPFLAGREDDLVQARLRAVNLLRESGAFDAAGALLDATLWSRSGPPNGNAAIVVKALRALLEDRNANRFAVTLYAPEGAAAFCLSARSLSPSEVRHCRSSEIRAAMQQYCAKLEAQNTLYTIEPACVRHRPVNRIVPPLAVLAALVLLFAMARRMRRADAEARGALAGGGL